MSFKIKISPKVPYIISILTAALLFFYFSYKATVAYLIHRELYGGGLDTLVLLRASIAGIMILLILLFIQFMKIKDLKSQRTILRGIFIGWTSVFIILMIIKLISSISYWQYHQARIKNSLYLMTGVGCLKSNTQIWLYTMSHFKNSMVLLFQER